MNAARSQAIGRKASLISCKGLPASRQSVRVASKSGASADLHQSHSESGKQDSHTVPLHQARQRLGSLGSRAQALTQSFEPSAESREEVKHRTTSPATASLDNFQANGNGLSHTHSDLPESSAASQNGSQNSRNGSQGGAQSPHLSEAGPEYKRVLIQLGKNAGHVDEEAQKLVYQAAAVGVEGNGPNLHKLERAWCSPVDASELASFSGRTQAEARDPRVCNRHRMPHDILADIDESSDDMLHLLRTFSSLCEAGHLEAGLLAVSRFVIAGRHDVLLRLKQKHFLGRAAREGSHRAVQFAFRFVEILPRAYTSLATYNMLITVCIQAKDLSAAMQATELLRSNGHKPDGILYNNLITACAAVGNADAAFQVQAEMLREGHTIDKQCATSLINACSKELLGISDQQRRQQLVLLERAGTVLQDFVSRHYGQMDQALWNAFLTAAGRASQLGRALQALKEMQRTKLQPNASTYGAIIDACVRNHDKELALKTYRQALDAGLVHSQHIYTGSIAACIPDKDVHTSLSIFHEMLRNGVVPDKKLYSVLISAVGSADPQAVLTMQEHLLKERVVGAEDILSSVVTVFLNSNQTCTALQLFHEAQQAGIRLSQHAVNALLTAVGKTGDLERLTEIVLQVAKEGFEADKYTCAAILNACQHANAGELAFSLWRVMQRYVSLDEIIAFILIRTCYNQIRLSHTPYDPAEIDKTASERQMGTRLVIALGAGDQLPQLPEEGLPWGSRAITVYQELLASGVRPKIHLLERLLACMKLWNLPEKHSLNTGYGAPQKMRQFLLPDGRKVKAPQQSTDGFYDKRAFSILKEATNLGCLPALAHHSASTIDFRTIPPVIAEVHLLDILSGIVELDSRRKAISFIVCKVEPFSQNSETADPTPVAESVELGSTRVQREEVKGYQATGFALAHVLRRIDLRAIEKPTFGEIIITTPNLLHWKRIAQRVASTMELASLNSLQKATRLKTSITDQAMYIRLGMPNQEEDASELMDYQFRPRQPPSRAQHNDLD